MKKLSFWLASIFCIVAAAWLLEDLVLTSGYAPSADPQYSKPSNSETQIMLIKNIDSSGNVLLFKANQDEQLFRYDPSRKRIEKGNIDDWSSSKEKELDCWEQSTPYEYSGPMYGHYLVTARSSPDRSKIAVLSAYGPKTPNLFPNLMFPTERDREDIIWGSRYLEIRDASTNESLQRPSKIDMSRDMRDWRLCWSDGARHVVVYFQGVYQEGNFSVVDVDEN